MSARNRQRREENKLARVAIEQEHRRSVMRIWAVAAVAVIALPACVFVLANASSDEPRQVAVENSASAETPPSTVAAPKSGKVAKGAKRGVQSTVPATVPAKSQTITRTITERQLVPVPVPGGWQQYVTPSTRIVQIPVPTTVPKPSKPCVASSEALQGGGTVTVKVGPAPTALFVKDLVAGSGAVVKTGSMVTVEYVAVLCSTGKIVDATFKQGAPATIDLDQLIAGWQRGLPGAKVGGTRLLGVPAAMAYGNAGRAPQIPPNEALWFQIKVLATDVTLGPPGAPTNVHATPGVAKAVLTWTAPSVNGSPITQYKISRYANGTLEGQQTVYTTAAEITVSGLTPGKSYTFKMAAQNSYGAGPDSTASNAVIPT
jgi:hypothetical protein